MSTELKPLNKNTTLTRFFGGTDRGVCVQVTQTGQEPFPGNALGMGYVQLNRQDAAELGKMLLDFSEGKETVDNENELV
jgi:hypothetical protein